MVVASKKFLAASIQHCRWLPCPSAVNSSPEDGSLPSEDLPAVLAGWAEDAKQHVLGVADVQLPLDDVPQIQDCRYKQALVQPDRITDLQVAQIGNTFLTATSNSSGGLAMLVMQLPDVPGATTADLQFVVTDAAADDDEDGPTAADRLLQQLPNLHQAPAASVAINTVREMLLSVAGDGSICLVQQLNQPAVTDFKAATGWSGFNQGRWVDSNTFATTGVLGGLQLWDVRQGPRPVRTSANSWGHTGCGVLDKTQGPSRQLLCLDVHPSRPDYAATGATGGTVAIWDLRFHTAPLALTGAKAAAGDVCECKFDLHGSEGAGAVVPPVLFCTLDGALCAAQDAASAAAAAAAADAGYGGSSWAEESSRSGGGLVADVLHREQYAICSFDVEPTYGRCILAATDDEHLLLLHMDDQQQQQQTQYM